MPCRETVTLHMPQQRLGDETLMRGLMGMVANSRVPSRLVFQKNKSGIGLWNLSITQKEKQHLSEGHEVSH